MSDGTPGSCLCGAVRFRVTGGTTGIGMCHCSRKVSGVASNAELMVGRDGLVWLSGEDVGAWRRPAVGRARAWLPLPRSTSAAIRTSRCGVPARAG